MFFLLDLGNAQLLVVQTIGVYMDSLIHFQSIVTILLTRTLLNSQPRYFRTWPDRNFYLINTSFG